MRNANVHLRFIDSVSLPLDLVKAVPSQQRVLHRLVYRCFPVLEDDRKDHVATHFIRLEVPLVDQKQVPLPAGLPGGGVFAGAMLWSGSSTNLDILLPDRYGSSSVVSSFQFDTRNIRRMDLRFNISDINSLASGVWPAELFNYLNNLENLCVVRHIAFHD